MTKTGIVLGVFIFIILCLYGIIVHRKWLEFRHLKPGDFCCRFVDVDSTTEIRSEEIVKVDTDENGYTTKIYTKNNSFSFWQCLMENIYSIYSN